MKQRSMLCARKIVCAFFCLLANAAVAQVDTSFWFAPPEVSADTYLDRPITLRISTLSQPASVTVSMPANASFAPIVVNIAPGSTSSIDLTPWIDIIESKPPNTVLNTGLKISSTAKVNVYYEVISGGYNITCQCNPEIFALKGKSALGKNFLIPSQNLLSNWAYNPPSTHSFDIVATEDNTTVTINPIKNIVGHVAGIPFNINLNRGQVYSSTASSGLNINHLGGSTVTSSKEIAITVKDDGLNNSRCWDMGGDQLIPVDNLSTEYIAIQGYLVTGITDRVFITAVSNNTSVYVGGVLSGVINANQTLVIPFTSPAIHITSSSKIYAFQMSGSGCEIGLSSLPSISCRGSSEVSFTRSSTAQLTLIIITRTINQNFFLLNGNAVNAGNFSLVPNTSGQWVYARITVPTNDVPALASARLTNSNGLFHLGVIHGDGPSGGARFGYFSDYSYPVANELPDSTFVCGAGATLSVNGSYSNFKWNTGATSSSIPITQSGLYNVSFTNPEGCLLSDSSYVKLKPFVVSSGSVAVCNGQPYTLPWGQKVNTSGTYGDTLSYSDGCDSVIQSLTVTFKTISFTSINISICKGQTYLGRSTAGTYIDTFAIANGCDSIRTLNLSVQSPVKGSLNATICSGQNFRLPSGKFVNQPGVYSDTIQNKNGCDSVVYSISLNSISPRRTSIAASVCVGQNFILPSGKIVSSGGGVYSDTIQSQNGCDSAIYSVSLNSILPQQTSITASVCAGKNFILPSGKIVSAGAGVYLDTVQNQNGCDSVIYSIFLNSITSKQTSITASVCAGQNYILPSGKIVSAGGNYLDTIKNSSGCDSLITLLNLIVTTSNVLVTKSNDISCSEPFSRLHATGGIRYEWSPGTYLSDISIPNPIASPVNSTMYYVKAFSDNICYVVDSIEVLVASIPVNSFLLPNAFSPNNDGKNDCFGVKRSGGIIDFELSVYNRWGQLIYNTKNPTDCWDGTFNNQVLPAGAFVYRLIANTTCGKIDNKGTVLLIK